MTNENNSATNILFDYIKLVVPFSISLTLFYETSFFLGADISLKNAPIGVSDLFRGWTIWLTTVIFSLIGFFSGQFSAQRRSFKSSFENSIFANPEAKKTFWMCEKILYGFLTLSFLLFGEKLLFTTILIPFTLSSIRIASSKLTNEKYLINQKNLGYLLTLILIIFYTCNQAFWSGRFATEGEFTSSSKLTFQQEEFKVVRIFDQWTLVKTSENKFSWIYHQSDRKIDIVSEPSKFIGLIPYCSKYTSIKICQELSFISSNLYGGR